MPNWCSTDYIAVGEFKSLSDLSDNINFIFNQEYPLVESDFGSGWCGNLIYHLGGDWKTVGCRGFIDYLELDTLNSPPVLNFHVISAWKELSEFRKFICEKYPNIKIVYYSEEPGCLLFETNDVNGDYFPWRYCLSLFHDGLHYYETQGELFDHIESITHLKVTNMEEVSSAISRFNVWQKIEHNIDYDHISFFKKIDVVEG